MPTLDADVNCRFKMPILLCRFHTDFKVPFLSPLLTPAWFRSTSRLRCKWIVRPVVFGVAALQLLLHFEVRARPEGCEVAGDLDGALSGGQQMQRQGHAAAGETRGCCEPENFL